MNTLPDWLTALLSSPWMPFILFAGAFGDAFIGTSLFILGEIFFIAGGYVVAKSGEWWLIPLIWSGALLGDMISYWIGRHYGKNIIRKFIRPRAKRRLHYQRAYRLMLKYGGSAIFIARVSGPLSKVMPLLAGTMGFSFMKVLFASTFGIIVATLQFFIIGWCLLNGVDYWHSFWNIFSQ